ncbi:cyclin-y-like protein 1-like [Stylonychia lemnae]|uniref:Cyclin-y-like protein 1-like n=1 Tax=Stylonychia lemnae TaxID=5949 RepID=A0A078B442_STYLE|nr:cyclin-y-like protein 1-like [Stylonychia lemnae]|eukprot:CDW88278.1 cyclin-y-like protein 1-like [Stylonychia lemnae]
MGNQMTGCCTSYQREQREKANSQMLRYSELPQILRANNQQRQKKKQGIMSSKMRYSQSTQPSNSQFLQNNTGNQANLDGSVFDKFEYDYHRIISIDQQNMNPDNNSHFDFDAYYDDPFLDYGVFNYKDSPMKKYSDNESKFVDKNNLKNIRTIEVDEFQSCNDLDDPAIIVNRVITDEDDSGKNYTWSNSSMSHAIERSDYSGSQDFRFKKNCSQNDISPFQFNQSDGNNDLKKHQIMLEQKRHERNQGIFQAKEYSLTGDQIITKISQIFRMVMLRFQAQIQLSIDQSKQPEIFQSSMLFNEKLYLRSFNLQSLRTQTMNPLNEQVLNAAIKSVQNLTSVPNEDLIQRMIKTIKKGGVQILTFNWRPILFSSFVLAAKYWEDIVYWNIDFVEPLAIYPLKSINQLENTFLGLCQYELFVSLELYDKYYDAIIMKTADLCFKDFDSFDNAYNI